MKKIIVPVDFSEHSEYAAKVAASLARKNDAEILAVHMLELSDAYISGSGSEQQKHTLFLLKLAEKRFGEFLSKPFLEGVKVTPVIKHFKVFSELNEIAQENQADLVVMGSHGSEGLTELFVGSNAEKVVRNSDLPVLVIKKNWEEFNIERFVFACDFKEENVGVYNKAMAFAKKLKATVKLVYINTPGDNFLSSEDALKRIDEFQKATGIEQEVEIYNHYTVEKGILDYCKNTNADMIGIPTHGRKGLMHFFMGSLGEDVANHAEIPVVTFKI